MFPTSSLLNTIFWAFFGVGAVANAQSSPTGLSVHFDIDASTGNKTEFGLSAFVETNVNRADDGGLYAELVQNRAFQEQTSYLQIPGWNKFGSGALYQDPDTPFRAFKQSLEIYVIGNATSPGGERAGVNNTGWFGIPIKPQPYHASFWVKTDATDPLRGTLQLALVSLTTGRTYASISFDASSLPADDEWHQLTGKLIPTESAPDSNNALSLSLEVLKDKDQYAWFNLISLFPPTFKDRANGLRSDLAEVIANLKPKHVRIPGGSNLQGSTIPNRFKWTNTLGPLEDRPGRPGYWGAQPLDSLVGYQTEGLGLKELLDMVEDFGATPILGVYDGYAADDESIPNTSQLDRYIQDAVNELHFVLGDASTNQWAKKRADLGHPEPYKVQFVEIGNEDYTSITYNYRWQRFHDALSSAYPNLSYIATGTIDGVDLPSVDLHDFSGPDFFYSIFDRYDNWPRNGTKIWELENGVINTNSADPFGTPETRLLTPTLQGSVAEAVFAIGLQRNGDLIAGTSYAPYLSNNYSSQWTPNLILFNITDISLSTSYYVHQMISLARADMTHPVVTNTSIGPLYWVATSSNASAFFVQIANINDTAIPITGTIRNAWNPALSSFTTTAVNASSTILAASADQPYNVTNNLLQPDAVVPKVNKIDAVIKGENITFNFMVPGRSFGVYSFVFEA